jgi:hypothetical protein
MKLVLNDRKSVPPDGYRFTHPETGHKTENTDWKAWLKAIRKYREDNRFPIIEEADIWDQFCKLLPPGHCTYESGEKPSWHINTRLGVRDVLNGTKVLASFFVAGMPLVSKELAESRSATCSRCYFNIGMSGCSPCVGLQGMIESIGGKIKTRADASLESCAVCKCSNLAQTRLPIEILAKGVTEDQLEKYPKDFCWKIQELMALSAQST